MKPLPNYISQIFVAILILSPICSNAQFYSTESVKALQINSATTVKALAACDEEFYYCQMFNTYPDFRRLYRFNGMDRANHQQLRCDFK
jgi:hypothetical protein